MANIKDINRIKFIKVDDGRVFRKIVDVMNSCFGKSWDGCYKGFIPLNDGSDYVVWFPGMAKKRADKFVPFNTKNGWLNTLSDDGKLLIEENENDPRTSISDVEMRPRYVFGHYENGPYRNGKIQIGEKGGYRFLGIFQLDAERSKNGHRESFQISDRADLSRYAGNNRFKLPEPAVMKVNENEDDHLIGNMRNNNSLFGRIGIFEYAGLPQKVKEPIIKDGIKIYPRDKQTAANALIHANFSCEIDFNHPAFIRKHSNLFYTEPHHLVPLAMQEYFDVSLDVEENIVSLCSNCHNEIHYGKDADKLIRKLYKKRKKYLEKAGIFVSEEELLAMYGYFRET